MILQGTFERLGGKHLSVFYCFGKILTTHWFLSFKDSTQTGY